MRREPQSGYPSGSQGRKEYPRGTDEDSLEEEEVGNPEIRVPVKTRRTTDAVHGGRGRKRGDSGVNHHPMAWTREHERGACSEEGQGSPRTR
ncbi:hypothetical protein NDU88_000666 [Pleurodeles waltl]|uniref:Uncharacterized protein n=1 Tax=Pleurodeles waltl TaxID=8319 RepID=A0AAV7UQM0_PLEWA|nr:hypothetical protein NDU88_000666 [Pleurodeles waltl]